MEGVKTGEPVRPARRTPGRDGGVPSGTRFNTPTRPGTFSVRAAAQGVGDVLRDLVR